MEGGGIVVVDGVVDAAAAGEEVEVEVDDGVCGCAIRCSMGVGVAGRIGEAGAVGDGGMLSRERV